MAYRQGKLHHNADALSRHPVDKAPPMEMYSNETTQCFPTMTESQWDWTHLSKLQSQDVEIGQVLQWMEKSKNPPITSEPNLKLYKRYYSRFKLNNNVLYMAKKIVLPKVCRGYIL